MCDPTMALAGAGMAANAIGTAQTAKAQIQAGRIQADTSATNALMYEEAAKMRLEKGKFDAQTLTRAFARDQGTKRSKIAASGVDARSFYDVLADDTTEMVRERKGILYNARAEAANLRFQAWGEMQQGRSAMQGAKASATGTVIGGIAQGVSLAAPMADKFSKSASSSSWATTVSGLK